MRIVQLGGQGQRARLFGGESSASAQRLTMIAMAYFSRASTGEEWLELLVG
jgi:hypothetical protein